jgi:Cu2+-exporting ATPase
VEKDVGDEVFASTLVLAGRIGIRTAKTGEETVAMQIGKILEQTSEFKNSLQSQGEAIADRLAPFTLGLSALFLPLFGYAGAMTVLTNEFGYKMRLFAPTSMLTFLNLASQEGILIKDGRSLELLNQIDTVVFDKTGTLTLEQPTVGQIHTYHDYCKEDILRYAAAAEDGQTHPIAKAILAAANERKLRWPKIVDAKYEMGYGIQVNLPDRVIRVGSDKFMLMNKMKIPHEVKKVQARSHEDGHSLVLVAFDSKIVGVIELHATIRPEAKEVIDALRKRGMSIAIISGDHEPPTKKLAETLGIDNYFANTLPENKANLVSKLQEEGKAVCFVGDGINDSIALKKANVSVSQRGATMIATDTAQIVLMDGSLNQLSEMFDIAQRLSKNMKTNYYLSTMPCVICIGGIIFFHWGLATGFAISISALFAGISNSILPLLKQPRTTAKTARLQP